MKKIWQKKTQEEMKTILFGALKKNVNYHEQNVLGVPASYLDDKIFSQDASFLKDAPFLSTLIHNPNHIGCHTLGKSESFFAGTHQIEREVIEICGVEILKGKPLQQDGYVASGGTEANIQAIWIYRNFFQKEEKASKKDIAIICSEDSHYSMDKAGNLLSLDVFKVPVGKNTREVTAKSVRKTLKKAKEEGKKHFIVIVNMMTTMYGSVDSIDNYINELEAANCSYKIHVDGAFGGFYYPFTESNNQLTFENPKITSFTLDAHKMAQAPYGTGLFLIRKGFLNYANTKATYVEGEDFTLIGSRSGANAVAIWMILMKNGPYGWKEKIFILQKRTQWICDKLTSLNIEFYRHQKSNIITIKSKFITAKIAKKFGLVPDNHSNPKWYKIVVMEHVIIERLLPLIDAIKKTVK